MAGAPRLRLPRWVGGPRERIGLVLAGGGARGAYEAGALSVLLPALEARGQRPTVIVGTSVGAINAAYFASRAAEPAEAAVAEGLEIWRSLRFGEVLRPLLGPSTLLNLARYSGEVLGLPGLRLHGLLDPSPLVATLREAIDWPALRANVAAGTLDAVALVATSAATRGSVVFVDGEPVPGPDESRSIDYVAAQLGEQHTRASAAIPVLFPAVHVDAPAGAEGWYFDGGTRLNAPIAPALDLGVDRLVVVALNSLARRTPAPGERQPDFADGAAQLLQAVLADPLVDDVRRLARVNELLEGHPSPGALRRIPYIVVAPRDPDAIGRAAAEAFAEHYAGPRGLAAPDVALLGRLVGADAGPHGELLSYLLFAGPFAARLIALGAADARAWLEARPDNPWQLRRPSA